MPGRPVAVPGEYLAPVGEALVAKFGNALADRDEVHAEWTIRSLDDWLPQVRPFAVEAMLDLIRDDLAALGVRHAVFTSERDLVGRGGVDEVLAFLEQRGLIYTGVLEPPKGKTPDDWEPRPQLLFEGDRVR